jgi:hypothetical protein
MRIALVLAALGMTTLPGFRSPTRNIQCFVTPGPAILHCSIRRADYAPALTRHCAAPPVGVDWGGFELGATRRAAVTCTGGVLYDPATQRLPQRVVAYGATFRSGPFTCVSRVTGITCTSRTGHGLFVSRQRYRLW